MIWKKRVVAIVTLVLLAAILSGLMVSPALGQQPERVKVLIGFTRQPGPAEQALVHRAGGAIKYTYHLVPAIAATVPERAIDGLRRNPNVTSVDLDGQVWAVDTELENAWGVKRIGAGSVHDSGNKGAGVKVAIIDSGIDYNHPDLDANFDSTLLGYDFVNSDPDPMDDYGHGTHVAGTVAAEDNDIDTSVVGVAPGAVLYALKVLNQDGFGNWSDIIAAVQWCVDEGMQVANLSLGHSIDPGGTVKAAFDNAELAGVVIVAAAGNSGNRPGKGNNVIYPARYDSVIAVAATDSKDKRASWSSTGDQVELAAPGVSVFSTWNDSDSPHDPQPVCDASEGCYKYGSGTSMASPHVAGTAALVLAANPGWTNDQVRTQLHVTADDLGAAGRDPQYGFGLVDAVEASGTTTADDLGPMTSNVVADPNATNGATSVTLTADVSDSTTGNSNVAAAEYFVGTVGLDGFGTPMSASDGAFDSPTEGVTASIDVSGWTVGQYTLYVHGQDAEGNWGATESVVLDVTEAPGAIMYVESIVFSSKVAGPNKFLYTTVKVVDGDGNPLGSVRVEMTLDWDKGGDVTIDDSWNFADDTGTDGTAKLTLLKAPAGYYTATVTHLILTDYTWDTTKGVTSASCELQDDGTVIQ